MAVFKINGRKMLFKSSSMFIVDEEDDSKRQQPTQLQLRATSWNQSKTLNYSTCMYNLGIKYI
jgi:hypothetical protein